MERLASHGVGLSEAIASLEAVSSCLQRGWDEKQNAEQEMSHDSECGPVAARRGFATSHGVPEIGERRPRFGGECRKGASAGTAGKAQTVRTVSLVKLFEGRPMKYPAVWGDHIHSTKNG